MHLNFWPPRGPSSFSKRSPKLAVLQVILGKDGMMLGRIDPSRGHTRGCPVTHLDFWPPGGGVYLASKTLKRMSRVL